MNSEQEGSIHVDEGDGRRPYVSPGGAPKPPPDLWAEMEAAGKAGDDYRLAIANALYKTWLHEQGVEGHPDPFHGHAPTEVTDDELETDGIF